LSFTPLLRGLSSEKAKAASLIFYIVFVNSWENIFALEFIESYMQGAIESLCDPATEQNIFLLKLAFFSLYIGCLIIMGQIVSFMANILNSRQLFGIIMFIKSVKGRIQ
jgi:hypothetical protein